MFHPFFFLMIIIVLWLWTDAVFKKPKAKTPEQQLGDALAKYLESGVRIRTEASKKDKK
jgi:hypothetical protein